MATCATCGLDPDRALAAWEEPHRRTSHAIDVTHLRLGAEQVSVDVTKARRVQMNRIRQATGLTLAAQIGRALDVWLAKNRIDAVDAEEARDARTTHA